MATKPRRRVRDASPSDPVRVLYVSGPMSGIPALNYPAFAAAAQQLRAAGFHVVSPHESALASTAPWHEHLRADLAMLLRCTGVATLEGAPGSMGARLECHVAAALSMPIWTVAQWLDDAFVRKLEPPIRLSAS